MMKTKTKTKTKMASQIKPETVRGVLAPCMGNCDSGERRRQVYSV